MRHFFLLIVVVVVVATFLAVPSVVNAGGFEIPEQSPAGVATAGAQTAVANDPSAIYYNPAGLAFQTGLGVLVGGNLIHPYTKIEAGGEETKISHTSVAPTGYVGWRVSSHLAVGIGFFSNFGEHFSYPPTWIGRFSGTLVDLTTATINPTVAIRPLPYISIGGGIDIVPTSAELTRGLNFGGGEGNVHVGLSGVGVGGNVGLLIELIRHRLNFGYSFRSRTAIDLTGHGAITAPPEVAMMAGAGILQNADAHLALPHNMSFALAGQPVPHLTLSTDVRLTLWSTLSALTVNLHDPTQPSAAPTTNSLVLNLHDTWGVRLGLEYRFLDGALPVRVGVGFDSSPVPLATLGPFLPDTDRVFVGGGLGYEWRYLTFEASYLAVILLKETSQDPDLRASYQTVGHVVSAGVTFRLDRGGNASAYRP